MNLVSVSAKKTVLRNKTTFYKKPLFIKQKMKFQIFFNKLIS